MKYLKQFFKNVLTLGYYSAIIIFIFVAEFKWLDILLGYFNQDVVITLTAFMLSVGITAMAVQSYMDVRKSNE